MTALESTMRKWLVSDDPDRRRHAAHRIDLGFDAKVEMVPCQGCKGDRKAVTPSHDSLGFQALILFPVPERTTASLDVWLVRNGYPVLADDPQNWRDHVRPGPHSIEQASLENKGFSDGSP